MSHTHTKKEKSPANLQLVRCATSNELNVLKLASVNYKESSSFRPAINVFRWMIETEGVIFKSLTKINSCMIKTA